MKLIEADNEHFCFQIQERERRILIRVLGLYPLVPPAHQRLSRSEDRPESREMLEEALAAQRRENKAQVEQLLKTVFHECEGGHRFTLQPAQMEWLLQVLNDVRVGSWLLLGSPAGPIETLKALNQNTAQHFWTMEMAGGFQQALLRALNRAADARPPAED